MTRKEFLEQAAKQVNFQNFNDTEENAIDCIRTKSAITANMDFLLDFFKNGFNGGYFGFSRYEWKLNMISPGGFRENI